MERRSWLAITKHFYISILVKLSDKVLEKKDLNLFSELI